MKKKLFLFITLINSVLFSAFAIEDSQKGIEFYKFKALEPAKIILLNSYKNSNANKAEVSYYLGEIYFAEGKKDSASFYFKAGSNAANPDYVLNEVGIAKLQFKDNKVAADAALKKIADKNKKKPDVLVAVAKAYFENGMKEKALEHIENAKKAKYAEAFVLHGDIYAAEKNYGKAAGAYEQALLMDRNCKEAYVRYADIYTIINPKLSIDILERLIAIDPSSPLAQRAIAETYFNAGQFGRAVTAYSKYAASEYSSPSDLSRYASILFYAGDHAKSSEIAQSALKKNPNDFVMSRLSMYNDFELKRYPEGLETAEKFMTMKGNQDFIWLDYMYYGRLLQKNKKTDEALLQFGKAREIDPSKTAVYKEIAEVYESIKDYDKAIANYNIFLKEGDENVKALDYFTIGRCNYSAGTAIDDNTADKELKEKKTRHLIAADSLFAYVAEKAPDSYLGNFWRARANFAMDPETEQGLAKPHYEAALALMNANDNKAQMIECYRYFGYYYLINNDKAAFKSYLNKILELDPNDKRAMDALKEL
jgi:tetratricopeptide (TPR) repeat protein